MLEDRGLTVTRVNTFKHLELTYGLDKRFFLSELQL